MLLGHGWSDCSWIVFGLSLPIYAGLLWAFQRFAPANLEAAGASAGLSAGGFAAAVYCIHCPANSAVFALVWYTFGILLAGLLGALIGRRLMRW